MSVESGYNRLYWESSFEIIQTLIELYPSVDVDSVGIEQLRQWIIALPNFADDPDLANDGILNDILREWYEEVTS
jgi:FeS assembly protein IscX